MSTINLIIGNTDFSEWVETDSYTCKRVDIIPKSFVCYDGYEIAKRSGYKYELSVQFTELPDKMAMILASELDNDTIKIRFTDPLSTSDDMTTEQIFYRPAEIGGSIAVEVEGMDLWDMEVSLTSAVTAVSGSL